MSLKLNISESDNAQDLSLAREVAKYFGIKLKRADEIMLQVVNAVKNWRKEASALKLSTAAQHHMAPAFRVTDNA